MGDRIGIAASECCFSSRNALFWSIAGNLEPPDVGVFILDCAGTGGSTIGALINGDGERASRSLAALAGPIIALSAPAAAYCSLA